jgi:hypothetical protein
MRRILAIVTLTSLLPVAAFARVYDTSNLPYSDAPQDRSTAIAVSVLTTEKIVQGNPDGTFRPDALLNRAEFLKIAMGLLPDTTPEVEFELTCFPDIFVNAWYAPYVCRAKALGIVEGNAEPEVPKDEWRFVPARTVQYVEALKIIQIVMGKPVPSIQGAWYERYLQNAKSLGTHLPEDPAPDMPLTRGDMARLVTRFLAQSDGELPALIAAEQGNIALPDREPEPEPEPDPEQPDLGSGSQTSSTGLLEEGTEEMELDQFDPDEDTTVRQSFLGLGETSPVLGGASVFSESQPLDVTSFVIRLNSVTSIDSLLVYDEDARLLGRAFLDTLQQGSYSEYRLPIKRGNLTIPKGTEFSFYVRAVIKSEDRGGQGGELVQVQRMGVEGNGAWNNKNQSAFSSETFPSFETAESLVIEVSNPESDRNFLIAGNHLRMGSFRFEGRNAEGANNAELALEELHFTLNATGGVTVSNVQIGADATDQYSNCTVSGNDITCTGIPVAIGTFEDRPRIVTVYGDISVPGGASSAAIQLSLNAAGSVQQSGAVRWTDGTNQFHWVPGEDPVANGTRFEF